MLFMVIETFTDIAAAYARFSEKGRETPPGLDYVDSWVDVTGKRCFLVMRCDDASLIMQWVAAWKDLVSFEIIPVATSKDAVAAFARKDAKP